MKGHGLDAPRFFQSRSLWSRGLPCPVSVPDWGSRRFVGWRCVMSSTSTYSSSPTSFSCESDLLGEPKTWNTIVDKSFHFKVRETIWDFCGCHGDFGDSPALGAYGARTSFVGMTNLHGCGTVTEDFVERVIGGYWRREVGSDRFFEEKVNKVKCITLSCPTFTVKSMVFPFRSVHVGTCHRVKQRFLVIGHVCHLHQRPSSLFSYVSLLDHSSHEHPVVFILKSS